MNEQTTSFALSLACIAACVVLATNGQEGLSMYFALGALTAAWPLL